MLPTLKKMWNMYWSALLSVKLMLTRQASRSRWYCKIHLRADAEQVMQNPCKFIGDHCLLLLLTHFNTHSAASTAIACNWLNDWFWPLSTKSAAKVTSGQNTTHQVTSHSLIHRIKSFLHCYWQSWKQDHFHPAVHIAINCHKNKTGSAKHVAKQYHKVACCYGAACQILHMEQYVVSNTTM